MKQQILSVCLHNCLSYPACKSILFYTALCCHVACLVLPYFSTLSHKRHDFRKKIKYVAFVFIFSTTFVWKISYSKKNWERFYHKCKQVFVLSTCRACKFLTKFYILGFCTKWIGSLLPMFGDNISVSSSGLAAEEECLEHLVTIKVLEFPWETFRRILKPENPTSGNRVVPCGQTDRLNEANSRTSNVWTSTCINKWLKFHQVQIIATQSW